MAISIIKNPSTLKVKLNLGEENGKLKTKMKSFSNLKHDALSQDCFDVATALMELQEHTLMDVYKVDNTTLAE